MKPLLTTLVTAIFALSYPAPGLAWVTSTLKSSETTIVVQPSGPTQITSELFVHVSGGVLKHFELVGVDRDATAVQAQVARVIGKLRSPLSALEVELVGDTLGLRVLPPTKLSRGTYALQVSYDLDPRPARLQFDPVTRTERAEVRWVGPRFADGVDSVRVRFRVPRHDPEPTLPTEEPTSDVSGEYDGVFFSTVQRGDREDVIELVRPHVARGEPVVWRVWVAPSSVPLQPPARAMHTPPLAGLPELEPAAVQSASDPVRRLQADYLGVALALALGFGTLVMTKTRSVAAAARQRGMQARPLLALGHAARWWLSVASVVSAAVLLAFPSLAALGALVLLLAMACATELCPRPLDLTRGPGVWRELGFHSGLDALGIGREPALPGGWLDARQWRGLSAFILLAGTLLWCSSALFPHRHYHAAILLLGVALWVPLFFSGTRAMFPRTLAQRYGSLRRIGRRLLCEGYAVAWSTRVPVAAAQADELRLRITPRSLPRGFEGMELGFEQFLSPLRVYESIAVVIRAGDGSPCHENFVRSLGAQGVTWGRGRSCDQRAAVFRPTMGGVSDALRLVAILGHCIHLAQAPVSPTRRKSQGSSERMRKPAKCSSPVQAT